ncbi:unnamed protein product, partial [Protopolystoma xenopodis]
MKRCEGENRLEKLPRINFERYLFTPYSSHVSEFNQNPVSIPISFGAAIYVLREKHDGELQQGQSFIETDQHNENVVGFLAKFLTTCSSFPQAVTMLSKAKTRTIFEVLLCLVRQLTPNLFPIGIKTALAAQKLLEIYKVHPYDHDIFDQLFINCLSYCTDRPDAADSMRCTKDRNNRNDPISQLIQTTYKCQNPSRQRKTLLMNRFNKRIFHDLHLITEAPQRNL